MEKQGKAVTVSRQMGSGGTYVGYHVAKTLGFLYVDREILRRAADLLKRDERSLEEYEGRSGGFIQNLMRTFALGTPEAAYIPRERPVYERDLFLLESRIIHEIVEKHDAVIMGRGAFHVLKGRPGTVHLFVHAPLDYRTERVSKADNTPLREAQARVKESDRRRNTFIREMVGTDWTDARNYCLSIDSSIVGLSETTRMVVAFVQKAITWDPPGTASAVST